MRKLFLILCVLALLSIAASPACPDNSISSSLRSFLSDLQKEYDSMTAISMKISSSIAVMNSTNSTLLSMQIKTRQTQLKKIQLAQQSLALELAAISTRCDLYNGDECNISKTLSTVQDVFGRMYPDGTYASSCYGYLHPSSPYVYNNEGSGLYQIKVNTLIFTVYCDMETMGGGWTLTMKTSSSSAYVYGNTVWTSTNVQTPKNLTSLALDEDYVSPAFYMLKGTESMLAMSTLQNYNTWNHTLETARNLANGASFSSTSSLPANSTCEAQTNCGTHPIRKKPLGIFQALSFNYATSTFYRFGYTNYLSINWNGWGAATRVGFSGDNNNDDSGDSFIGIGIKCTGDCAADCASAVGAGVHGKGSGYYFYRGWNPSAPNTNGALRGWLWIR